MKSIKNLLILMSITTIIFSCSSSDVERVKETASKNASENLIIGYMAGADQTNFVEVAHDNLLAFFNEYFSAALEEDGENSFNRFEVLEYLNDSNQNEYTFVLYTESETTKIGTKIYKEGNVEAREEIFYAFRRNVGGNLTCQCSSINCAQIGCNPKVVVDECSCTWCDGDCKKTATLTQEISFAEMMESAGL